MGKKKPSTVITELRVRPYALREARAAEYVGLSQDWLRKARRKDIQLIHAGQEPQGPVWFLRGQSVYYKASDLEAWLAQTSVERGAPRFRGASAEAEG